MQILLSGIIATGATVGPVAERGRERRLPAEGSAARAALSERRGCVTEL